jgi:Fe2+ or Zn2+ uptake regulation protein
MGQSKKAICGDVIQLMSDICRQAGLKLTRPQVEVLRELAHSQDDATAEKIHFRLRERLPRLSREAVRRTLKELERFGIVHEIAGPDEVARPSAGASSVRGLPERKGAPRFRAAGRRR